MLEEGQGSESPKEGDMVGVQHASHNNSLAFACIIPHSYKGPGGLHTLRKARSAKIVESNRDS